VEVGAIVWANSTEEEELWSHRLNLSHLLSSAMSADRTLKNGSVQNQRIDLTVAFFGSSAQQHSKVCRATAKYGGRPQTKLWCQRDLWKDCVVLAAERCPTWPMRWPGRRTGNISRPPQTSLGDPHSSFPEPPPLYIV
jgi:hypothetical protein